MKKRIEMEHRSRFSKTKYDKLKKFLAREAKDLGRDDKNVYFFIFFNKFLKVTDNISKKTAKITLKLNKIGKGSHFEEIEFFISQNDKKKAINLFEILGGYKYIRRAFQVRHNYLYKGVEISLKYSAVWNYHAELEIVISDLKDKKKAEEKISAVANELGLKLMSQKELKEFVKKFEKNRK